jgi:hypothetical protein
MWVPGICRRAFALSNAFGERPAHAAAAHLFNPRGAIADREISIASNFFCTTGLSQIQQLLM